MLDSRKKRERFSVQESLWMQGRLVIIKKLVPSSILCRDLHEGKSHLGCWTIVAMNATPCRPAPGISWVSCGFYSPTRVDTCYGPTCVPKNICWSLNSVPVDVTLFRKRVLAGAIKLRWGQEAGPLFQYDWCSYKKKNMLCEDRDRERTFREMEEASVVMYLQAKEPQMSPASSWSWRWWERILPKLVGRSQN